MSDRIRTTVGQLGELFDGPHATPVRRDEGPFFLNISSLKSGRLDLAASDHVSPEDFTKWTRRVTPRENDLLFSYETRLGEAALMPAGVEACLGRRMALLRPDPLVVDPRFLLYLYLSPSFQRIIQVHTIHGATVPRIGLATMPGWEVKVPRLPEQRAIADVLGAIDDKIGANERVLRALAALEEPQFARVEAMTQRSVRLGDVASIAKGYSYRRTELGSSETALVTLKSISRNGQLAHRGFKEFIGDPRADQVVRAGDIVVAQTDLTQAADVIGRAVRVPQVDDYKRLVASLDLIVVRSVGEVPNGYLLGALRTSRFRAHCQARMSGTTVLHLGRGAVDGYEVPLAPVHAILEYCKEADARAELADSVNVESRMLGTTRDVLLPALMAGQLSVRDAGKVAEGLL